MSRSSNPGNGGGDGLTRRELLQWAGPAAVGAGAVLTGADRLLAAAARTERFEHRNRKDTMAYAPLGRTHLMVSRLSLGGVPLKQRVVQAAIELGVNLVHGSHGYGTMPKQAEALRDARGKFFYALKGQPTPGNVDRCLQTMGIERVDLVLPVFGDAKSPGDPRIRDGFDRLKKAGKVRFLGATVHCKPPSRVPDVIDAVTAAGCYDVILCMYQSTVKRGIDVALRRARKQNIGSLSMKTLQGLHGSDEELAKVIGLTLAGGTIDAVLKGVRSVSQLRAFAKAARSQRVQTGDASRGTGDLDRLADRTACGGCGTCAGCARGVAITDIMRCQTYYGRDPDLADLARQTYRTIPAEQTVLGCADCGSCERVCPRGLAIRELLADAHQRWA